MKTVGRLALVLVGLLLVGFITEVVFFLYALLFGGPWRPFLWGSGLLLVIVLAIKLFTLSVLDDKRHLHVAAMISELISGAFGWTSMVLAVALFVLFFKALLFGGAWSNFFICLLVSSACKWFTRFAMTNSQVMFMRHLVEQGMSKEEARHAWTARRRQIIGNADGRRRRSGGRRRRRSGRDGPLDPARGNASGARRGHARFTHVGEHRAGDQRPDGCVPDDRHRPVGLRRERDPPDEQVRATAGPARRGAP